MWIPKKTRDARRRIDSKNVGDCLQRGCLKELEVGELQDLVDVESCRLKLGLKCCATCGLQIWVITRSRGRSYHRSSGEILIRWHNIFGFPRTSIIGLHPFSWVLSLKSARKCQPALLLSPNPKLSLFLLNDKQFLAELNLFKSWGFENPLQICRWSRHQGVRSVALEVSPSFILRQNNVRKSDSSQVSFKTWIIIHRSLLKSHYLRWVWMIINQQPGKETKEAKGA